MVVKGVRWEYPLADLETLVVVARAGGEVPLGGHGGTKCNVDYRNRSSI